MKKTNESLLNYPLIVSDFDGTILTDNRTIPQEVKDAIEQYKADGGIFVVSTGRMYYGVVSHLKALGLNGLVSCAHGTYIFDMQANKPLFEATIPTDVTADICEKMEALGLHCNIYTQTDIYTNQVNKRLENYEKALNKKAVPILDRPLSQFVRENGLRTFNVLAFVDESESQQIINALSQYDFPGCTVTKSEETLVEVVNANYSKGTAVQFLANHFGIPIEKTIAVGDQWNDISMIKAAGLGCAVKNARHTLKKYATVLEYTNNEGAIAKMIKKYAYK